MRGGVILVPGEKNNSTLIVHVSNIPGGLYMVQLRTHERNTIIKMQILK